MIAANPPPEVTEAARLMERGYALVRVAPGTKRPVGKRWQSNPATAPGQLAGHNIGILLGELSGWLVDVDLDCPEAVALADQYLPHTDAITGRTGQPGRHRWYIAEGATTTRLSGPDGAVIAEMRSTGAQTVVGPSIHPDGTRYDLLEGEPAKVDAGELLACIEGLRLAVLAARGQSPAEAPEPVRAIQVGQREQDEAFVIGRARGYLATLPPSISGAGGHAAAFRAASALVHGFALDDGDALALLRDDFNPRCEPAWSEKELRHKVRSAGRSLHSTPRGYLRDAQTGPEVGVDLSGFAMGGGAHDDESDDDDDEAHDESDEPPRDLPPHLLEVPGLVGEIRDYILCTAHKPQPAFALGAAISIVATVTGRKIMEEQGNRTNIYFAGLAGSGGGKERPRKCAKLILEAAGAGDLFAEDAASDAGIVKQMVRAPTCMWVIDEVHHLIESVSSPKAGAHQALIPAVFLKLWSSADSIFTGKVYSTNDTPKILQPCASIFATGTRDGFLGSLTDDLLENGFFARLIVLEGLEDVPVSSVKASPPPASIVDQVRAWHQYQPNGLIGSVHPTPDEAKYAPEAWALVRNFAELCDDEARGKGDAIGSVWARGSEKACRLALIYAASTSRPGEPIVIGVEAVQWATEFVLHTTRRVLWQAEHRRAENPFHAMQLKLAAKMRGKGGEMSKTEIARAIRMSRRQREDVVDAMLDAGDLRRIEVTGTGGRKKTIYRLRRP